MYAKKSLGQHFLHDKEVVNHIVCLVDNMFDILEIGPGLGALTDGFVNKGFRVDAVEFDSEMVSYLEKKFKDNPNVNIIKGDATRFTLEKPYCVVGNLPYNVSKKIIVNMSKQRNFIKKMIFMVQKEVADSIIAQPNTKAYTKFSIFVQIYFKVRKVFDVLPHAFKPSPKVISSVVEFIPYDISLLNEPIDSDFFLFLRKFFSQPNKTVKNNLKKHVPVHLIQNSILNVRPRQANIQEIYKFFVYLKEKGWA